MLIDVYRKRRTNNMLQGIKVNLQEKKERTKISHNHESGLTNVLMKCMRERHVDKQSNPCISSWTNFYIKSLR
jgi:hypothetical protein